MRLWIYASLLAIAVGIASWTAVHRHRQTLWLRAYREANDSLQRGHYADAEGQLLILTGSKHFRQRTPFIEFGFWQGLH
jgi:hypothetical protein